MNSSPPQTSFAQRVLRGIRRRVFGETYYNLSYAQEGEDIVLSRIFNPHERAPGFYVDIGAHHPTRSSWR